jgi:adenine deaminase
MKKNGMIEGLKNRIRAARVEIAPDLILKGGRVINVFSHEVLETEVAIYDGIIVWGLLNVKQFKHVPLFTA